MNLGREKTLVNFPVLIDEEIFDQAHPLIHTAGKGDPMIRLIELNAIIFEDTGRNFPQRWRR